MQYMENINATNIQMLQQIEETKQTLEYKNTRAYKNKILKADKWMKNRSEEVIFLISEEQYNKYTDIDIPIREDFTPQNLLDEKSLISTMSIYEKWIYLIFKRDIR